MLVCNENDKEQAANGGLFFCSSIPNILCNFAKIFFEWNI